MRQVYVRSSARVYEIYYATKLDQKDNEYLCTVRCSLAQKEDQSNNSTNEDGWVEILDTQSCSISKKNDERSIQDFYEATAEITDSSPCVSLTIRLLSLHTKECVHLEDIYIFGEPVEIVDLDDKVDPMKRSAEISMMAMLPTLMQLSRTGMPNRMPDKQVSDIRPHLKGQDDESLDPYVGRTLHSEALSSQLNQKVTKDVSQSTHVESDELVPGAVQEHGSVDKLNDSSSGRIERVLDQLVCRVGRIEAFCSRFEDNMLKPISNIETRLERLEKQLEVLTVSSQSTDLNPCRRIRAPDFSCIESETNSLQNDEEENSNCGVSQFASKDATSTRQSECLSDGSESNDNAFISTVISQLVPSIPCIQSETKSFQNDEGENSNCGVLSESLSKDATFTTQLKCLSDGSESNDNASDSVDAPQSIPGLIVTAPEFSNEDF
ncbi:hypothetical protein IFM89_006979 [Coptis chinensis]|uniref:Uncharacterized protein n=1 Tax=Coptis chinensis TaxID=261450 RepID=A0A835HCY6_9MAGN|nr:hypothetical protein IFM89_006979 [Coptis chinensis]